MNVESLSKKKIVEKVLTEYFEGNEKIVKMIIEEEVIDAHNFNIVRFIEMVVDITKEEVKRKVEWFLKEIEKGKNFCLERCNITKNDYWRGRLDGLIACENLIKKAFEGVLKE